MASRLIFCPLCGHKSRVRKESIGKEVKCKYCLEKFVVTPEMVPQSRFFARGRLLFWTLGAATIIIASACVYLWKQEDDVPEGKETTTKVESEPVKPKSTIAPKRYYLVTFEHMDNEGNRVPGKERVYASGRSVAESIIQMKYKYVSKLMSVLDKEQ